MGSFWMRQHTLDLRTEAQTKASDFLALLHDPRHYLVVSDFVMPESIEEDPHAPGVFSSAWVRVGEGRRVSCRVA